MSTLSFTITGNTQDVEAALKRVATGFENIEDRAKKVEAKSEALVGKLASLGKTYLSFQGAKMAVSAFKDLTSEFARLGDLADRLGISGESIQRLSYLAQQGGADVETMARAMTKMTVALNSSQPEAKKAAELLGELGINVSKFKSMAVEEQIIQLADAFDRSGGDARTFSTTLGLLGQKAGDLIPTFRMGAEAVREMLKEAPVLGEKQLDDIKQYDDAMQRLYMGFKAAAAGPVADLALALTQILGILDKIGKFAGEGRGAGDAVAAFARNMIGVPAHLLQGYAAWRRTKEPAPQTPTPSRATEYEDAWGNSQAKKALEKSAEDWEASVKDAKKRADAAQKAILSQYKLEESAFKEDFGGLMKSPAPDAEKASYVKMWMDRQQGLDNMVDYWSAESAAAGKAADLSLKQFEAYQQLAQDAADDTQFGGKPLLRDVAEKARQYSLDTGVDATTAEGMARADIGRGMADAIDRQRRTNRVFEQRESRRIEREGRMSERANKALKENKDKPMMVSDEAWELAKKAQREEESKRKKAEEDKARKEEADAALKKAQEARDANQELIKNLLALNIAPDTDVIRQHLEAIISL